MDLKKLSERRKQVLACFVKYGELTARECSNKLGFYERNATHPRINELEAFGLINKKIKTICKLTGEKVWIYELNNEYFKRRDLK